LLSNLTEEKIAAVQIGGGYKHGNLPPKKKTKDF